ncbi:MAG: C40 family peptidase [Campylobacteraceae bacterium]|jgi:lipoprotein Spr|nr:C40 family peptidase [Campylobacteraceae bacterium]
MKKFITVFVMALSLTACSAKSELFHIDEIDNRDLYESVLEWFGTPYKIGGMSKNGVDCSGFVKIIYEEVYSKTLGRTSADIYEKSQKITESDLREGDLVFFKTSKNNAAVNHVGIYLKNGRFVHASTTRGVVVSDIDSEYYQNSFVGGGRVE